MSEVQQIRKEWVVTGSEGSGEFFLDEWYVSAEGIDGMVAIVNGEANARRIVAAQEMLEALEAVCETGASMDINVVEMVWAAIAKAKGQA